jgi:hypothetical protein
MSCPVISRTHYASASDTNRWILRWGKWGALGCGCKWGDYRGVLPRKAPDSAPSGLRLAVAQEVCTAVLRCLKRKAQEMQNSALMVTILRVKRSAL